MTADFIPVSLNLPVARILTAPPPWLLTTTVRFNLWSSPEPRICARCHRLWSKRVHYISLLSLLTDIDKSVDHCFYSERFLLSCEMLTNLLFPEQDSTKYGQHSSNEFVWIKLVTQIQKIHASFSLFRGITHVNDTEQLCTTADAENGIEGFTSCFAGHEDLNSLCQKLQFKSSGFSEVWNLFFKLFMLLSTDSIATEKSPNIIWQQSLGTRIVLKSIFTMHARVMPKV